MATIQSKAGVTLLFGLDGSVASVFGYIGTDGDQAFETKEFTVLDTLGAVAALACYNQIGTFKFTGLFPSGANLPAPGGTASAGGFNYVVLKTEKKQSNSKFTVAVVDLKRYVDNGIP